MFKLTGTFLRLSLNGWALVRNELGGSTDVPHMFPFLSL